MHAPFKLTFLFFFLLLCTHTSSGFTPYPFSISSNPGTNTSIALCSTDANAIDLFSSLNGNPDSGGVWEEEFPNGIDLSNPTVVDLSALPPNSYNFIYTIPADSNCPDTSAILTIMLELAPNAGGDNSIAVCNADSSNINLYSSLLNDPDLSGTWEDNDDSGVDISNPTAVNFVNTNAGFYNFNYTLTGTGSCLSSVSILTVEVNEINNTGSDGVLRICNDQNQSINLFDILNGNPDQGGVWTDNDDSLLDLSNPNNININNLAVGNYTFTYSFNTVDSCPTTSATATLIIEAAADFENAIINTFCDNNDTPADTFDDTFSYTISINSVGTGSGFVLTSNNNPLTIPYNTVAGPFGDFPIEDGSIFITISDLASDGICSPDTIEIVPPENCSGCTESVEAGTSFALACTNPFVLLTGSGSSLGTYAWTGSNGFESNLPNPTVSDTGTYVLTVFFENGCVESDSVYVSSDFSIPTVDAGENMILDCTETSIQLNADVSIDNPIIEWSFDDFILENETSLTPTFSNAGWYYLTVTNPLNGCSNTDSIFIEPSNFIDSVDLNVFQISCAAQSGGSIEIGNISGGAMPYLYNINNGSFSTNPVFENLSPNDYVIGVEDSNGCTWDTLINIFDDSAAFFVDLGQNLQISLGDSVQLDPFISIPNNLIETIEWTTAANLSCDTCPMPWTNPTVTTSYNISVEHLNGCIESDDILIFVDGNTNIYIPNAFSPNNDGVNDLFQIYSNDVLLVNELNIFDRWGNLVYKESDFDPSENIGWDGTFRGKPMNPAVFVYYARITLQNGGSEILKGDVTLTK